MSASFHQKESGTKPGTVQVPVYKKANKTKNAVTMVIYYSAEERATLDRACKSLGIEEGPDLVFVNARDDDKPSGSKA